jgi:uncharacterized protein YkwD
MGFAPRPSVKTCLRLTALPGLACLAACLTTNVADGGSPRTIEVHRVVRCVERPGGVELRESLNAVARQLSRGERLHDAIHDLDFPVSNAESVYAKGPKDDAAIRDLIEDRYCTAVKDVHFTDVGIYRSGDETWIVLAARTELPAAEDSAAVAARVLELVNAARKEPRRCGDRQFGAARPLTLSPALTEVASLHARDMALQGALGHRGSDGSEPAERVSRAGYRWRAVGENVASGQTNADAVVAGWLDSPGHCANIMGPQFTEMGASFALAPSEDAVIYWAQEFAAPQ